MRIIRHFISLRYIGHKTGYIRYVILECVATETVRCMATISTSDVGTSEVSEIELETSNSADDASVDLENNRLAIKEHDWQA